MVQLETAALTVDRSLYKLSSQTEASGGMVVRPFVHLFIQQGFANCDNQTQKGKGSYSFTRWMASGEVLDPSLPQFLVYIPLLSSVVIRTYGGKIAKILKTASTQGQCCVRVAEGVQRLAVRPKKLTQEHVLMAEFAAGEPDTGGPSRTLTACVSVCRNTSHHVPGVCVVGAVSPVLPCVLLASPMQDVSEVRKLGSGCKHPARGPVAPIGIESHARPKDRANWREKRSSS